jgi:Cu+-exporting ATPase
MTTLSNRFESGAGSSDPPATWRVDLEVDGMTCVQCPPFVEKWLRGCPGVDSVTVDPDTAVACIDLRPREARLGSLVNLLRSVGYSPGTATVRVPARRLGPVSSETELEAGLRGIPGVLSAKANPAAKTIDVKCKPEMIDSDELLRRVARIALPGAQRRSL